METNQHCYANHVNFEFEPIKFSPAELAERQRRIDHTNKKIKRQRLTVRMLCNECGKKFNAASINGRCPKCRGCDFEPC